MTEAVALQASLRKAKEDAERLAAAEQKEAERKIREEAELQAREAERKAREANERIAREEAERQARMEDERRARQEAERKAREGVERKAREEAERRAREEVERRVRLAAERRAREEAERRAREEAERRVRLAAERRAREEAERRAREEAERRVRLAAERRAREEAERREREAARQKALEDEARERQKAIRAQEVTHTERRIVSDSTLVTFSAGFSVETIVTGFELCRMTIKGLPLVLSRQELEGMIIGHGVDESKLFLMSLKRAGNSQEAIVFLDAREAQALVWDMEGEEVKGRTPSFELNQNGGWNSMGTSGGDKTTLTVTWFNPTETVVATYNSHEDAQSKLRELNSKQFNGNHIRGFMDTGRKNLPYSLRLHGFPLGTEVDWDLYQWAGALTIRKLPPRSHDVDIVAYVRSNIECDGLEDFAVIKPDVRRANSSKPMRARARFDEWEAARTAADRLERASQMNGLKIRIFLPKQVEYVTKIPSRQYEVQRRQWTSLPAKANSTVPNAPYVFIRHGNQGDVFVTVEGNDRSSVGTLKVRVEGLVNGTKLDASYWHPTWRQPDGKRFLENLSPVLDVYVRVDFRTSSLRIYGDAAALQNAMERIKEEIQRLSGLEKRVVLEHRSIPFFVRKGLESLKELIGEDNVDFMAATRTITVKGGEEGHHHLNRLIAESKEVAALLPATTTSTCPVCFGDPTSPEELACEHTYCSACLQHLVKAAKDFPLLCFGGDGACRVPVALPVIQRFVTRQLFEGLAEAAFAKYMDDHPNELKYCTTADCQQIYRRHPTPGESKDLQCPSCFKTVCTSCDDEPHEGISCEDMKRRKETETTDYFEQTAASNGLKKCPSCSKWIQKIEGCNHMTCTCGTHFCWRCGQGFGSGNEVYNHLRDMHGGIYGDEGEPNHQQIRPGVRVAEAGHIVYDEAFVRVAGGGEGWGGGLGWGEYVQHQREALEHVQRERQAQDRLRQYNAQREIVEERRRVLEREEAARRRLEEDTRRRQENERQHNANANGGQDEHWLRGCILM